MWILPKNLIQSHSLQVMEELNEVLNLQENESITLPFVKSKPMPLRTLSQRWKQGYWIRALYGRMLRPSQENNFLERWISSQEDSLASHSQVQEVETQTQTQDTYGLHASEQLSLLDLIECSSRMLKDSSAPSWEELNGVTQKGRPYCCMSLESWKEEVTKQRGEYSQRVKQAHLIREKESLSSVNWQTPTVLMPDETPESFMNRKKKRGFQNGTTIPHLLAHVKMEEQKNWPTPNTMDTLPPKSQEALDRNRQKGGCANLREWVHHEGTYNYEKNWPTPRQCSAMAAEINPKNSLDPNRFPNLETVVGREQYKNWPTPTVSGTTEGGVTPNIKLTDQGFKTWRDGTQTEYGAKCRDAVIWHEKNWPTPTTWDWKGHYPPGKYTASNGADRMGLLPDAAVYGPQDQDNHNTNGSRQEWWKKIHLNPEWVETLMGLPENWTLIEWTDSDY